MECSGSRKKKQNVKFDTFKASVNKRKDLLDIQKFQYLSGYLVKGAKKCIAEFQIMNANLKRVLGSLNEIKLNDNVHMNKIKEIKPIESCDIFVISLV